MKSKETVADELELVAGSAEDDFTEALNHIRERELLYGDKSLLTAFVPIITHVCTNNKIYNVSST